MKVIDFLTMIKTGENTIEISTQDGDTPVRVVVDTNREEKISVSGGDTLTIKVSDYDYIPYWICNFEIVAIELKNTYVLLIL